MRKTLEEKFRQWTETIAQDVAKELGDPEKLLDNALSVAMNDVGLDKEMDRLINFLASDYKDMESDVKRVIGTGKRIVRRVRS
jgi:hypothetical protein